MSPVHASRCNGHAGTRPYNFEYSQQFMFMFMYVFGSGLQFLWSHQATQRHVNVKQKEKNASIKTVLFRAIDIGMYLSRE